MAFDLIWTSDRSLARSNRFDGKCANCGRTVEAMQGQLVSTASVRDGALGSSALHEGCALPTGYHFRARTGMGQRLADIGAVPAAAQELLDAPEPQATPEPREATAQELQAAAQELLDSTTQRFLEQVPPLVRSTLLDITRTVEIKLPKRPVIKESTAHKILPDIVMALTAGTNPLIVGPAGGGKTTLCQQAARVISKKFYMANSVAGKHELLGFRDAHGKPVHTDFYKAFKTGGLFMLDEMDNSNPNALVALNSAIANGFCEFAGEMVTAHKDFQMIATANTFGRGADQMYVGRNRLDGATLDRFEVYVMDYDEELELMLAGNDDWTMWVQQVRRVIYSEKISHIVSPRASIAGAKLLSVGMERSKVEEACVWKGLDNNHRARVVSRMGAAS